MMSVITKPPDWPKVNSVISEATPALFLAKLVGALAGSIISIAYILPRGRHEALLRLTVGFVSGLVFGSTAGVKMAEMLGILDDISAFEIILMGATLASLCAWWGVGLLKRVLEYKFYHLVLPQKSPLPPQPYQAEKTVSSQQPTLPKKPSISEKDITP